MIYKGMVQFWFPGHEQRSEMTWDSEENMYTVCLDDYTDDRKLVFKGRRVHSGEFAFTQINKAATGRDKPNEFRIPDLAENVKARGIYKDNHPRYVGTNCSIEVSLVEPFTAYVNSGDEG